MVHVCADERVRIVIARQEFVDDHSLVNEIDAKRAASKLPLLDTRDRPANRRWWEHRAR